MACHILSVDALAWHAACECVCLAWVVYSILIYYLSLSEIGLSLVGAGEERSKVLRCGGTDSVRMIYFHFPVCKSLCSAWPMWLSF